VFGVAKGNFIMPLNLRAESILTTAIFGNIHRPTPPHHCFGIENIHQQPITLLFNYPDPDAAVVNQSQLGSFKLGPMLRGTHPYNPREPGLKLVVVLYFGELLQGTFGHWGDFGSFVCHVVCIPATH
jgi:hypothetical protein